MGCGGSRMNPEREAVASKFPPRFRHRFEEIKRRRNAAAMKGTLSKKELLKEGDASHDSADDKSPSPSSPEESLRAAKIAPEPEPESIKEEDDNNVALEEENIVEKDGQDEQESEEEERFGNIGVGYVCPGSPSFRVYCAEALEPINNDIAVDEDDIVPEEKPRREDSGEIVSSMNSNEGSSKGLEVNARDKAENGKKGKRLRKRKSNPVKKLLNVKSCYCNGGHHNNARLLSQKTVA
ncbi:hypothetical protein Dsin_030489 [Dipteronia sinensis]|uniref:Uncharacterized protein n=1 Tax=Dipteronia sinensis TaxID=43782 RepID=A0AAD9ZJB1_9ROSI|nr:hypothetical protein Dsin_030489 [Dipteronia sinensis]